MAIADRGEPRAGVARGLVDGGEEQARLIGEDGLGTVTMVGVEIPDRDSREAVVVLGVTSGDGDMIEVAEAHGLIGRGVVARGAVECDGGSASVKSGAGRADGSAGCAVGVGGNTGPVRGIGVEIDGDLQAEKMGLGVGETGVGGRGGFRFMPSPTRVGLRQVRNGGQKTGWLFGPAGMAVRGAVRIVEKQHGPGKGGTGFIVGYLWAREGLGSLIEAMKNRLVN